MTRPAHLSVAMIMGLAVVATACNREPQADRPASGAAPPAPSAEVAPPPPSDHPAEPGDDPTPTSGDKTLGDYLAGVAQIRIGRIDLSGAATAGPAGVKTYEITLSDPAQVAEVMTTLDLSSGLNGPVARCPDDYGIEFQDKAGQELGSLGICTSGAGSLAVRFSPPDAGGSGGVTSIKDPERLAALLRKHGSNARLVE